MTKALRFLAALLVALPVFAQAQRIYSQPELDQMLAPVALYPDPLLSQLLMAATYPLEVAEAARWTRANPGLQGDAAVRAVQNEDWDPSVKSLVAFPQLLARMDENLDWTRRLGEAFLAQEPHVMDTVQQLRRRAQAAGNLQSGEQLYVQQQGQTIVIQPASPQYVYVPYYDPMAVYGPWWWPAYRPIAWTPWPRPVRVYLSFGFFFGNFDWHQRHVRVVHPTAYYYRSASLANRSLAVTTQRWQPDTRRREAIAARRTNEVQQIQVQSAARVQAQPAAAAQAQPTAQSRTERREERREERRTERQAAPAATPLAAPVQVRPQRAVQPTVERREERQAARAQVPPQVRQEQRANMPAAQAAQTPRSERQELREKRQEQRREREQKG